MAIGTPINFALKLIYFETKLPVYNINQSWLQCGLKSYLHDLSQIYLKCKLTSILVDIAGVINTKLLINLMVLPQIFHIN